MSDRNLKGGLNFRGGKGRALTVSNLFTKRTAQAYRNITKRILFKNLPCCTLEEFRSFVRKQLDARVRCFYCYRLLDETNFSPDHKEPLSRGGHNTVENIRLVCSFCNRAKGDFEEEVFVALLKTAEEAGAQCGQRDAREKLVRRLARGLAAIYQRKQRKG
ncbi:MAG TPA: HNH endonuclease signature motif containing protein [Pyrinomonadaceae bacterium]|nr:HNH endonuclease signature motif containing protein [Pyrinomonadaceae bacterium]